MAVMEEMEIVEVVAMAGAIPAVMEETVPVVMMKTIMDALEEVILGVPVHPVVVSQLWTLKKEGKLQEWVDDLPMVEMAEAIMVAHAVAILVAPMEVIPVAQGEAVPVAQGHAAIQNALLPIVTGEGVHRIVRVILVHQGADLQQCLKKN
jgi:hypothetical protein